MKTEDEIVQRFENIPKLLVGNIEIASMTRQEWADLMAVPHDSGAEKISLALSYD